MLALAFLTRLLAFFALLLAFLALQFAFFTVRLAFVFALAQVFAVLALAFLALAPVRFVLLRAFPAGARRCRGRITPGCLLLSVFASAARVSAGVALLAPAAAGRRRALAG